MREFFNILWRGGTYSNWWASPNRQTYWFKVGNPKPLPKAADQDIYFSIHPTTHIPPQNSQGADSKPQYVRTQNAYVASINCVYVDIDDTTDLDSIETETAPSVVICSGTGLHCYWLFDEPFIINDDNDLQYAKQLQANWITHVSGADAVKDLARVLRVPGTTNYKDPDNPRPVEILMCDLDRRYCPSEFELDDITIPEQGPAPRTLPNASSVPYFQRAIESELSTLRACDDGRNIQTNKSAFAIGSLVAVGALAEDDAKALLVDAAMATGLDESEATRATNNGLAAGMKSGRSIPDDVIEAASREDGDQWQEPKTQEDLTEWLDQHEITYEFRAGRVPRWTMHNCPTSRNHSEGATIRIRGGEVIYKCTHPSCRRYDWPALLEMYDGDAACSSESEMTRLRNALRQYGDFSINLLENTPEFNGNPIEDGDLASINHHMIDLGYKKRNDIADGINIVSTENAYHPVQDYLNQLQWDGQGHVQRLLAHFTGDDIKIKGVPVLEALITKWLLGCVERALGDANSAFRHQNPMLVLSGAQGIGKSSFVRYLCTGVGMLYHKEGHLNASDKDDLRTLVTTWIWEVSELGSTFRKSDRDALKALITMEHHTYRTPYAKTPIRKPVLCNLVGTINPEIGFLDDPTGNRRYMPVNMWAIDHSYSKIDINQVWAEIVAMYKTGASPALSDDEEAVLSQLREQHRKENPIEVYFQTHFDITGDKNDGIHTAEIIRVLREKGVSLGHTETGASMEISKAMVALGIKKNRALYRHGVRGAGYLGIRRKGAL